MRIRQKWSKPTPKPSHNTVATRRWLLKRACNLEVKLHIIVIYVCLCAFNWRPKVGCRVPQRISGYSTPNGYCLAKTMHTQHTHTNRIDSELSPVQSVYSSERYTIVIWLISIHFYLLTDVWWRKTSINR